MQAVGLKELHNPITLLAEYDSIRLIKCAARGRTIGAQGQRQGHRGRDSSMGYGATSAKQHPPIKKGPSEMHVCSRPHVRLLLELAC